MLINHSFFRDILLENKLLSFTFDYDDEISPFVFITEVYHGHKDYLPLCSPGLLNTFREIILGITPEPHPFTFKDYSKPKPPIQLTIQF
jgi:hypothetical protein